MRNPGLSANAFFLILFFIPLFTAAQGTLTGTVTGGGKPLENATVSSKSGGTFTDQEGKYVLKLPAGSYSITFSIVGFVSQTVTVTITNGKQTVQDISLEVNSQGLESVLIVGTRSLPRSAVGTPLPVDNLDIAT